MKQPTDAHLSPPPVSPGALLEDYRSCHVERCPEPCPCLDEGLLSQAREQLIAPGTAETSVLPALLLHRGLLEEVPALPSLLPGLIRATEVLEVLCLNLYVQPWRKEIRKIKTFTGVFVYCLLPALNSAPLQSVLESIGYLPQDTPTPSEYILSEDSSPEEALSVGLQMFQTRALCLHLLQLLQHDPPTAQDWINRLRSKLMPEELQNLDPNTDLNPDPDPNPDLEERDMDRQEEEEEEVQNKMEEKEPVKEVSEDLLPRAPGLTDDHSIVQMHMTYPDLVFRGRPLLQDSGTNPAHKTQVPHRRHAQRGPAHRGCAHIGHAHRPLKQQTEEGPSGPPGLSLHITLRPQNTRAQATREGTQQHPNPDSCDAPVRSEEEEETEEEESKLQPTSEDNQETSTEEEHPNEEEHPKEKEPLKEKQHPKEEQPKEKEHPKDCHLEEKQHPKEKEHPKEKVHPKEGHPEEGHRKEEENQHPGKDQHPKEEQPVKSSGPGCCERCTQYHPPPADPNQED